MIKFEKTKIALDESYKPNQSITLKFPFTGDSNFISSIEPSCGCSQAKIQDNNIVVNYKTDKIPYHLKDKGTYSPTKFIRVYLQSGELIVLSFTVKIEV